MVTVGVWLLAPARGGAGPSAACARRSKRRYSRRRRRLLPRPGDQAAAGSRHADPDDGIDLHPLAYTLGAQLAGGASTICAPAPRRSCSSSLLRRTGGDLILALALGMPQADGAVRRRGGHAGRRAARDLLRRARPPSRLRRGRRAGLDRALAARRDRLDPRDPARLSGCREGKRPLLGRRRGRRRKSGRKPSERVVDRAAEKEAALRSERGSEEDRTGECEAEQGRGLGPPPSRRLRLSCSGEVHFAQQLGSRFRCCFCKRAGVVSLLLRTPMANAGRAIFTVG